MTYLVTTRRVLGSDSELFTADSDQAARDFAEAWGKEQGLTPDELELYRRLLP